ncbi:MAG: M20/M25/M40 family metallo-hydrolase, partial [Myxococcales bacterium]|nr:M20/M25/M40 family metallo-hydrolase [Myxococcales bacterium]
MFPRTRQAEELAGEEERITMPISSYDDLAGVDLKGKVALIFDSVPNQPDFMALFKALQKLAEDFEAEAKPLREEDDLRKLEALHTRTRKRLVELVSTFVDTKDLPEEFWKIEDPKAGFDFMGLSQVFWQRAARRPQFDPGSNSLERKLERLHEAGAVGAILVPGPRTFLDKKAREADVLPGVAGSSAGGGDGGGSRTVIPDPGPIPVVQLRWKQADKLLRVDGKKLSQLQAAIDGDLVPRSQALGLEVELAASFTEERVEVPNVVAVLPGETDELVVLGAHFDHIGNDVNGQCRTVVRKEERDGICNGADDNASGTAMLLELARAYKQSGITPKRTLVFAHFSGEELGLLGSHALSQQAPFDMNKVVAMVNLDMIG